MVRLPELAILARMGSMASSAPPPASSEFDTVSATDAKNAFGAVLDRAISHGGVAITKHEEVRAVLLEVATASELVCAEPAPRVRLRSPGR